MTALDFYQAVKAFRAALPCEPESVSFGASEQRADGSWVLRNATSEQLASVKPDGTVDLYTGTEVTESDVAILPVMVDARHVVTTVWRCPRCRTVWSKRGNHDGAMKTCRQCNQVGFLRVLNKEGEKH